MRVAVHLAREEDELPGAVVLGNGVCAAGVDAARDLAVGELVRGVPAQVIGRDRCLPEAQQRLGDHRAVANPRARVRACSRTQNRTVARDENVCERRVQRIGHRLCFLRYADRHPIELRAPRRRNARLFAEKPLRRRAVTEDRCCGVAGERSHDAERRRLMRGDGCRKEQRARCVSELVVHVAPRLPLGRSEPRHERPRVEGPQSNARRCREWIDVVHAVDHERITIPGEIADRAGPAEGIQELRRRIDLERSRGERQGERERLIGEIGDVVAGDEVDIIGRAGREGGDAQRPVRSRPLHARHRQIVVDEERARIDVGPRHHLAALDDERLEREAALADLERTVFRQKPGIAAAIDADQRPRALLPGESAREMSARRIARKRFEERVGRRAESEVLDTEFGECVFAPRTFVQHEAQVARFRLGEEQRGASGAAVGHPAHGTPFAAIIGKLHVVA